MVDHQTAPPVGGEWGFGPSKPSLADVIACDVCERMRAVTETDPVERHVLLHGAVQEAVAAALTPASADTSGAAVPGGYRKVTDAAGDTFLKAPDGWLAEELASAPPPPAPVALVEALRNMVGCFDTPIRRRKFPSDIGDRACQEAHAALSAQAGAPAGVGESVDRPRPDFDFTPEAFIAGLRRTIDEGKALAIILPEQATRDMLTWAEGRAHAPGVEDLEELVRALDCAAFASGMATELSDNDEEEVIRKTARSRLLDALRARLAAQSGGSPAVPSRFGGVEALKAAKNALDALRPVLADASADFPGINGRKAAHEHASGMVDAALAALATLNGSEG